jgi:hypothetical protein
MANTYTLTQTTTSFTVKPKNDVLTENDVINITIKKVSCEGGKEVIRIKTLTKNSQEFTYIFNLQGRYEVNITEATLIEPFTQKEVDVGVTLTFFNSGLHTNLLYSTIDNILSLFCGCNCHDCGDDCGKKDSDYSTVLNKLLSLNIIKENYYTEAITQSNSCIKCDVEQGVDCELLQEKITGSSDNKEKIKKLIAYYYLVYYYKDLLESATPDEVTKQYKYNDIYKCIKHLGLDINCIKTKII